jgi:hypothetical protein
MHLLMQTRTTTLVTLALGLVTAAAGSARAAEALNYGGIALGARTHYRLDCATGDGCDRNADASGKVYFGHKLDDIFGAEAFAFRLGDARGSIDTGSGRLPGRVRAEGLGVAGTARVNVDAFTFKARLGVAYEHGRTRYDNGGTASKNSLVPVIGLGASYAITPQWALTSDWDRFGGRYNSQQKAGVSLYSVGVAYSF